jgi:calcium release-activated calcium channel protein 1
MDKSNSGVPSSSSLSSSTLGQSSDIATAFLTALDTSLSKKWREEDRTWRQQDINYRKEEREYRIVEQLYREQQVNWRKSDLKQRTLDNARVVWNRYVEKNRRDVEEKSEQLKSISNLSALIAGFAVVSLVELNFTNDFEKLPSHVSEWLISAYAASTALVVGLMLNSMVLCTFILSSILKRGKSYVSEDEEAEFLFRCRRFANHFKPGDYPPQPKRTFERHWENRCESSWKKAFYMFTLGVPVFLTNLACCAWLKFSYSKVTNGLVSGIVFISALVWAKTNKDWGWEIAKGSDSVRTGINGKKSLKRGADVGGKINGLPFDWHARPKDDDDDDDDEEDDIAPGDDRAYFGYEDEDEENDDDEEREEEEKDRKNTSSSYSPTNTSDDSALEKNQLLLRTPREERGEGEIEEKEERDERVFVPIHENNRQ